ncbi:MAG: PAS domain S-box protein [Acidobacteriota bacterium]
MSAPFKVLLIEDSEDDALLILRILRQGGYDPRFERVDTPESFIRAIDADEWDCIIADYSMPRFNAFAALALVRERKLDLPFIVVSGTIGEETAVEAMKAGAHDYLMKGNLARLVPAIEREMREAEVRRERERAERALQESERRFRALVENSTDGVSLIELDGTLLYTGPSTRRILGYDSAEIIGLNIFDFIHPDDVEGAKNRFIDMIREPGRTIDGLIRFRHRDGSWRWIEHVSKNLISESSVQAVVSNYRDVTERRMAEENQARLVAILEATSDFVGIANPDGRAFYLNRAGRRMVGIGDDEDISETFVSDYHPEWAARVILEEGIPTAIREGMWSGETALRSRDGSDIPVLQLILAHKAPDGGVGFLSTIARDITERKRAEESLRLSEKKYRDIFESAPIGIFQSTPDGRFIAVNAALTRILGYDSPDELMQINTANMYYDPNQRAAIIEEYDELGHALDLELLWKKKDGSPVWVQLNAFAIKDERGKTIRYESFARDITERKRAQEALQRTEEQLRQSQKMEAVGRLAGGVAHDFNNLLTAIIGCAELMWVQINPSDPLRPTIEEIIKAGERAAELTSQLLAFSRKQMLQPRVLDLNAVVTNLEKMLWRLIGEDIELVTVLAPDLGRVKADPSQIEQVILNLIVNSRDAMPDGGKVLIETANIRLGEASGHPDIRPGPYVMIAVSDTGLGMDAETRQRIFEPFFTTKETGQGTGLGLSTVYGIIKQSGGDVSVYSEQGAGTTFKIYLPRVEDTAAPERRSGERISKFAQMLRGSETVLVVEDDQTVRKLACQALRLSGYHVLEAANAGEALLICERHDGVIHLMLADVIMPQMSGRELAVRLAPMRPEMKTLFMSGYTDNAVFLQGGLEQGVAFIQKPFTPNSLSRKVRRVLDGTEEEWD